ncbi:MAG TPA: DUF2726 domain-containing protein [Methylibium sp.]|uniref:DUF2726 domain-containing protein n=1 Tax=Methylibium sp. TaxID=2067992 RepID=UPI002DB81C0D|nr:DUF2726 domain-containing protein [Methylibium sp.]HEU4457997.1 DUF2726 domain-containing protein [Methylibium sp.]
MSVALWLLFASALGTLGGWAGWRAGQRRTAHPLPDVWDLDSRPVLNADERQAMRHLREALPHNTVLAKLPLVRLCQPRSVERQQFWFELLGNLHVSFAICSANARVLAVIDLEPPRGMSSRAMRIKQSVLGACRIRYVHCKASQLPPRSDLELLLRPQGQTTVRVAPLSAVPPRAAAPDPHFQQARSQLSDTVRTRRAGRSLPADSMFAQDSFFAPSSQLDLAANSDFPPSAAEAEAPIARR